MKRSLAMIRGKVTGSLVCIDCGQAFGHGTITLRTDTDPPTVGSVRCHPCSWRLITLALADEDEGGSA